MLADFYQKASKITALHKEVLPSFSKTEVVLSFFQEKPNSWSKCGVVTEVKQVHTYCSQSSEE